MSDVAHKNVEDELAELLSGVLLTPIRTVVQKNQRRETDRDNCTRGH